MKIIGAGTVILVALTLGILEVLGTPYLLDSSCVSHKPAKANIRVINGRDADIHDNPWMVMIIERGLMKCGGSLIHPRYVLTAAHCTGNHPLIVRLGEYDLTNRFDCDKKGFCQQRPKEFNVSRVYSRQNEYHHNDIALLKLERNVEYRDNIRPICVILGANQHEMFSILGQIQQFNVTGWGRTGYQVAGTVLQQTTLRNVHPSYCNIAFRRPLDASHICAFSPQSHTCSGDSGGPLSANVQWGNQRIRVLFGIVSYGFTHCFGPTVVTNVFSYASGIEQTIKKKPKLTKRKTLR